LVAVSVAVVTVTPVGSLAESGPTFVVKVAVLKNVPADVPALTLKMKSLDVEPGTDTLVKVQGFEPETLPPVSSVLWPAAELVSVLR
jgi:hypothetical protein